MEAIVAENLRKTYKNGRGIHGIDLSIDQGQIVGFLGPNGAGKSTTIRTIMGLLLPDGGHASVLGHDVVKDSLSVRRVVGYVPGEFSMYSDLTGEENVGFSLQVRGLPGKIGHAHELAGRLGVDLTRRVKTLSHGQKQKVAVIAALAHEPEVIILDEPTIGLDPIAQEVVRALVREEVARGRAVFLSSHVLSEVEELCDHVAIINNGLIVASDTVAGLKKRRVKRISVEFSGPSVDFSSLKGVTDLHIDGTRFRFTLTGSIDPLISILSGKTLVDLTVQDPSLEEVFMAFYTGDGDAKP